MKRRLSLIEQRLQSRNDVRRHDRRRALLECAPARSQVERARVIAGNDALRIAAGSHERYGESRVARSGASLGDRAYERKASGIEGLGGDHENEECTALSKKFIEMHGGRVWVESEVGRGSSFIFEVPLRASAQKEAES